MLVRDLVQFTVSHCSLSIIPHLIMYFSICDTVKSMDNKSITGCVSNVKQTSVHWTHTFTPSIFTWMGQHQLGRCVFLQWRWDVTCLQPV